MSKKIGFRHYQEQDEDDKQKQEEQKRQTAIADFLRQNYAPIGATSQKVIRPAEHHRRIRQGTGQTAHRGPLYHRIHLRPTFLGVV